MDKKIKRAIISVSDKTGIVEFAKGLEKHGVEIISTGGTLKTLAEAGVKAKGITDFTGFPEILEGRVKTLHPAVFAGLLAKRNSAEHLSTLEKQNLVTIDLVAINLYPFEKVIQNPETSLEKAIENIDIGGPSMLRAAAKNFYDVTAIVDPADYTTVINEMTNNGGGLTLKTRSRLALKVYQHTALYDSVISDYLSRFELFQKIPDGSATASPFPDFLSLSYKKIQDLRYGENSHQRAAFYKDPRSTETSIANAKQLHGKELSYNNICDLETALEMVKEFDEPACVILKHANPCGAAIGAEISEAYKSALSCDPVSAFGGIIGLNRKVDKATAEQIAQVFTECVIAPGYEKEAIEILTAKKNIRLLETGEFKPKKECMVLKSIVGGLLITDRDDKDASLSEWKVVSKKQPTEADLNALWFGWKIVKWVKSNAIVFTAKDRTLGVGAGQMSRVDSVKIAAMKANAPLQGSYLASDAFFPMPDGIEEAAKAGAIAIVQPGGSVKDTEVIQKADELGLIMVFTGIRHFRH